MSLKVTTMYGADWCPDCLRAKAVLERLSVNYKYETADDGRTKALEISGRKNIPCIQFPDGSFLTEPNDTTLESKIKELKLSS